MAEAVLKAPSKWDGGLAPFGARYGKLMMWFFLLSDAFTFGGLLISYGLIRFSNAYWPDPDIVFNGAPFIGDGFPLVFVGIMTFILIASSLTMVLAVEYGHESKQGKTALYYWWVYVLGLPGLGVDALDRGRTVLGVRC
jgi:cytochrome c oxidase subunit 3